jgi:hypothetical protein
MQQVKKVKVLPVTGHQDVEGEYRN